MMRRAARRFAGTLFTLALIVVLFSAYVALVYHGNIDAGAGWVSSITFGNWIAGFSVVLGLLFLLLIIVFMMPVEASPGDAAPMAQEIPPEYPAVEAAPVEDTMAEEAPAEDTLAGPQVVERMEKGELKRFLVLRCGNCNTQFETPYSETRPLVTNCTNCGRRGILN